MISPSTKLVRAGLETDTQHGAVMPPIVLSSNFSFEAIGRKRRYDYSRSGNPTRDLFAAALAELEGAADAVVTPTGMAAIALFCQLLKPGDLVIAPHDGYGGSHRLFTALASRNAFRLRFVDYRDVAEMAEAEAEQPAWFWVETPSNPLMRLTDIESVVRRARRCGARVAVDNTFLTPLLQAPIALGADLVVHSTTKYINGHSDVIGGCVAARDEGLAEELAWWANCLGVVAAPFDSYLALRGLRTLALRMKAHEDNAAQIAACLEDAPAVRCVHWPGLASHPDHALARRQQNGFGPMLSFELENDIDVVSSFVEQLRCFSLAESLGGVESLVAHPATMTHASMDEVAQRRAGITAGLLRISPGIEDTEDLLRDLGRALAALTSAPDPSGSSGR